MFDTSQILVGQELWMENVLSARKKMTAAEMNAEAGRISQFIAGNDLVKVGATTTATFSVENNGNVQIMDVEILIPLDKPFTPPEGCVVKPVFCLTNALKIRHTGNPAKLQETVNSLLEYIAENNFTQITPGYNVTVKEAANPADLDNMIVDIYVGISPNIL